MSKGVIRFNQCKYNNKDKKFTSCWGTKWKRYLSSKKNQKKMSWKEDLINYRSEN